MTKKKNITTTTGESSGFVLGGSGSSADSANEMRERRLAALEGGGCGATATTSSSVDCPNNNNNNKNQISTKKTSTNEEDTVVDIDNNEKTKEGDNSNKVYHPTATNNGQKANNDDNADEGTKPVALVKVDDSNDKDNDDNNEDSKPKAVLKKAPSSSYSSATKEGKPLTDDWRSWLRLNLARGCQQQVLYDRCVVEEGFCKYQVMEALEDEVVRRTLPLARNNNNEQEETGEDEKKETTTKEIWPDDLKKTEGLTSGSRGTPVNNGWKEWIRVKLDQGSNKEDIFLKCLKEGLNLDQVSQALGGYRCRPMETELNNKRLPFMKRTFYPRAWKLDTDLAEVYEIPNFLTKAECVEVIQRIDNGILQRSIVTDGNADSRTSHTCHLRLEENNNNGNNQQEGIVNRVEQKLQSLMGGDHNPDNAETLQGQRYSVGQYFHAHTDWFTPNTEEYNKHCRRRGGQRTWTVMIYLNSVEEGGGTKFIHLDREFIPRQGTALVWNNLDADGVTPNPWTLHEAMAVTKGIKYVLTKWFQERPMV